MQVYLFFFKLLFSLLFVLVSVAFFTLFERKILGYSHIRFGPNKLFLWGVFQPFSDALKLFFKRDFKMKNLMFYFYSLSPMFGIFLSITGWMFFPFWGFLVNSRFSFLLVILLSGFSVYFLLWSGWSTVTKYSMFGSYRSSAQSISYEVVMIMSFLVIIFIWFSISFVMLFSSFTSYFFMSFCLFFCWILSCIAECNRSPFDFSEGESELVSGFNTEYGGGLFSLLFIGEYSSIIFFSFLTSFLFFISGQFLLSTLVCFLFLWTRCSFPRLRYDFLMMMGWKGLLILLLGCYLFFLLAF